MERHIIDNSKDTNTPKYAPVEDEAFKPIIAKTEIGDAMSCAEDELIKFVEVQIQKMDSHLLFDGESSPALPVLDRAIMQHQHVMLALTSLYEQARWDLEAAKAAYNEWHAFKFIEVRTEVNDPKLAKAKWYTKEKIDYFITTKYAKEQAALLSTISLADSKRSLIQHLIDGWSSYQFQLTQLSKNGIAEKNSSDVSGYSEDDPSYKNVSDLANQALSNYDK
mgnify:FL=1